MSTVELVPAYPQDSAIPGPLDSSADLPRAVRSARTAALVEGLRLADDPTEQRRLRRSIVELNQGVAQAVGSRYRGRGIDDDDLCQVACEGLIKAVNRFDPASGNDLLSYAVPTIRGELLRHFRDRGWAVRPPRRVQELQWKVNQCIDDLESRLRREPTDAEICAELDIDELTYQAALVAFGCFSPTSLDQPAGEGGATLGELIPDDGGDAFAAVELNASLGPALRLLGDRDRRIVQLRFGDNRTQAEIGRELGVTQMQVSRLLGRVLDQLRDSLDDSLSESAVG